MTAAAGTLRDQIENSILTGLAAWGHLATLGAAVQYRRTRDLSKAPAGQRIECWITTADDTAWAQNSGHLKCTAEVRAITSQAADASGATAELLAAYVYEALRSSTVLTAIQAVLASTITIPTATWRLRGVMAPNQSGPSAENPREHLATVLLSFVATYDPT